ncbi:MAG: LexA family transcriptional regulator [Oscillospiraceae bacterium]|nr:LexA family transcriptional regulator [Oscillospiraceae bacterium]
MNFGQRLRARREELKMSRAELAEALGVSRSAIGNYETGVSFPKEDIMLRLFDCLDVEPNYLYRDSFSATEHTLSASEHRLVKDYRSLTRTGQETVHAVVRALSVYQEDLMRDSSQSEERIIPLYRSPAAAGYASPVFGEDFDYISATADVPRGAEFAVRIQGDSMTPYIGDGSVVYVNRDPLKNGDVGIFCVDGDMLCKQYFRDRLGMAYLFSLNRARADADVSFPATSGRSLVCVGRVMLPSVPPLPVSVG